MSPILVRPVREQLEHDRLIRHLQQKYKRKFDVAINVGDEQVTPVKIGPLTLFPDLVLITGKKLAGIIEVETGESVNNLEAMAQWVHFSRSRVPFHLYVPVTAYETARRLSEANNAQISEVWTYRPAADGFDLVRISTDTSAVSRARGPMATVVTLPPKPAPAPPPPPPPTLPPAPVAPTAPPAKTVAPTAPVVKPPARPAEKKPLKPAPKPAPKPAAKPVSKPTPKPAPKPVKKPASKPASARAKKPAAKPAASSKKSAASAKRRR